MITQVTQINLFWLRNCKILQTDIKIIVFIRNSGPRFVAGKLSLTGVEFLKTVGGAQDLR